MLKHGILGLLKYGDMTGYEIMKDTGKVSSLKDKKSSMITMLIPWITFWVAISINAGKLSIQLVRQTACGC